MKQYFARINLGGIYFDSIPGTEIQAENAMYAAREYLPAAAVITIHEVEA
jgi:hypothetical protein